MTQQIIFLQVAPIFKTDVNILMASSYSKIFFLLVTGSYRQIIVVTIKGSAHLNVFKTVE